MSEYIVVETGPETDTNVVYEEVVPMTRDEAVACVAAIRALLDSASQSLSTARQRALDLHRRRGWKALGYASYAACAHAEFGRAWQHVYRLKSAALVDEALLASGHDGGPVTTEPIPVRHAQQLAKLADPEDQREAYRKAQELAALEGTGARVTERHVSVSVQAMQAHRDVVQTRYGPIAQLVIEGQITSLQGRDIAAALDKLAPRTTGLVMQLIVECGGLSCAELVPLLAQRLERQTTDDPSRVIETLRTTRTLAGTPLLRANLADWGNAVQEAQTDRIVEREAATPALRTVILTLYPDDVARSLRVLKRQMGDAFIDKLVLHASGVIMQGETA